MLSRAAVACIRRGLRHPSLGHLCHIKPTNLTRSYASSSEFVPADPPATLKLDLAEENRNQLCNIYHHLLPQPLIVPDGWSADWKSWNKLLTLFHTSPYFLRIPQIDMLFNIRYRLRGKITPIIYSDDEEHSSFLCRIGEHFYLYNFEHGRLHRATAGNRARKLTDATILGHIQLGNATGLKMREVPISIEGEAMVRRIVQRDPIVGEELARDDWLTYQPQPTSQNDELEHIEY